MRLVFYELRPGRMLLDVITEVGEPVTLEVHLPASIWAVAAVEALDRWVGDSSPIAVATREGRHGRRLEVSDGETRMTLDLLSPGPLGGRPRPSRLQMAGYTSL